MMENATKATQRNYLKVGTYTPATDNTEAVIDREFYGQGYIFKDEEAYETSLDQVCYIPELTDNVYTHQDFLSIMDGQEELARDLFDRVDWQHPETLFEEDCANGEYDNCSGCGRLFACYEKSVCPHCGAPYTEKSDFKGGTHYEKRRIHGSPRDYPEN